VSDELVQNERRRFITSELLCEFPQMSLESPDLAPSDYHLFTDLKNWLGSQRFSNNLELMEDVKTWLSS
jgi:hypothetical protein